MRELASYAFIMACFILVLAAMLVGLDKISRGYEAVADELRTLTERVERLDTESQEHDAVIRGMLGEW